MLALYLVLEVFETRTPVAQAGKPGLLTSWPGRRLARLPRHTFSLENMLSILSVCPSLLILNTAHSHFTASIPGGQAHLSLGQSTRLLWLQLGHPAEAPAGPSMGHEPLVLTGIELAQVKLAHTNPFPHVSTSLI